MGSYHPEDERLRGGSTGLKPVSWVVLHVPGPASTAGPRSVPDAALRSRAAVPRGVPPVQGLLRLQGFDLGDEIADSLLHLRLVALTDARE